MFCYNCGRRLSEHDFCTACGVDVSLYKKIMCVSNMYYNEGLEKAGVRDLSGAITSLRQSLKFNKNNIEARNLLGLVYFEMGEVVAALSEWVISKNLKPEKNVADDYIEKLQSNYGRLDSINSTIKKYNQALVYCNQDSKDLAVIQLKKVLSLNPRFIRAHQLLALLYMDQEEWERAERELRKCIDIDRNNTQTLRYLHEVERMLTPDETVKTGTKHRKDEAVRYQSDNEIIIQPLNVKEPKRSGVGTLVNIGIGLVLGIAVTYFLVVPAAETNAQNEAKATITKISNESDAKTVRIQELESQITGLSREVESLEQQIEGYVGNDGTLQTIDKLLVTASNYIADGDIYAAAADLAIIAGNVNIEEMTEGFQILYNAVFAAIGPQLSAEYYTEGYEYFRTEDYAMAIETLEKSVEYDTTNADALYFLGRSYQKSGDTENAVSTYARVMELFPGSDRAKSAERYKNELAPATE